MPPGVPGLRVAAPPVTERSSPMPGEAGVPAAGVRAQTRGTRPLCPSLAPFLIVSSSASPDARTLGSPGSTGETVSGSTPVRGCGAGRRGRERETFRAGCGVCCAAGPRSPPTAGTRGHCRKPTRPAQAASRPRPPIPHAGAPHWLRSFISRGASLFPARQRISRLPAFSGS